MQQSQESRLEITYADQIEQLDANLIKVPPDFIDLLDQQDITISGQAEDQFVFSAGPKSFRLRGIFLPTTMLVTPALDFQQACDHSNSQHRKAIAKVLLETTKYLKIEPQEIQFHTIYRQVANLALSSRFIEDNVRLEDILQNEGVSLSQLKATYQLTPPLIEKLAAVGPFTFIKTEQECLMFQLQFSYLSLLFKKVWPFLLAHGKVGEWFTFPQISEAIPSVPLVFFETAARSIQFESNPPLKAPSVNCSQMEIERQYRIGLISVLKFFMFELVLDRQIFIESEMSQVLKQNFDIFLPIGHPQFSEVKASELLPEITAQFFVSLPQKDHVKYEHYDSLSIDPDIKARIQYMGSFKKKFSRAEILGFLAPWHTGQEAEEILMKKFRKMGKEYEIKLIMPK